MNANFPQAMLRLLALAAMFFSISSVTYSQEQTWTVNFKDTDIQELIRFVGNVTKKTIVIDPRVKGKVQVISAKPVNREQLYDLFLATLNVHGFAAVESGDLVRVVPGKDARTSPVPVLDAQPRRSNAEVMTHVIQLENISAAKLIPVLRPLAPQQAHMAAYAPSNAIIISDTAENIARIRKIIDRIDRSAVERTEVLPLEHASAEEVVRMMQQLEKHETKKGGEAAKLLLVADQRTNSVLVNGDEVQRQRAIALIKHLDTPLAQSGNARVMYLEYANAVDLAKVLNKVVKNIDAAAGTDRAKIARKKEATIEADEGTNSLIITASADVMQSLMAVVQRLDIRRAQVLVEAIIVEMRDDDARNLGVQWLFMDQDSGVYGGSTFDSSNGAIAGSALEAFAENGDETEAKAALLGSVAGTTGQVIGVGNLSDNVSFNVVINALKQNTDANILSTPSLLTLDNEEASIVVADEVPVVTGSYTSTGNGSSTPGNPFQTIEREDAGIILQVTPQINEGDALVLDITQEVSDVLSSSPEFGAVTSKREIKSKVLTRDGQTIVLGGLIQDDVEETVQKVPLLGDIPFLGRLFRSTSSSLTKKHLMVFLRTTIVRDDNKLKGATAEKYSIIRDQQLGRRARGMEFIDDESLPLLPEWQQQLELLDEMRKDSSAVDLRGG